MDKATMSAITEKFRRLGQNLGLGNNLKTKIAFNLFFGLAFLQLLLIFTANHDVVSANLGPYKLKFLAALLSLLAAVAIGGLALLSDERRGSKES